MDVTQERDAIIIGSGLGGLAAAAALAKAGKKPLVFEHHFLPGGNTQTFRRRKMFDFDVGLHYIGGCEPGSDFVALLERLGVEGVEFLPMDPDGFDTIRTPDLTFRVPVGWDRYRQRLVEAFPQERAAIDRCLAYLRWVTTDLRGGGGEPPDAQRVLNKPWREATLGDLFDALEISVQLRHVLAAATALYGVPPSRASIGEHAMVLEHYLRSGGYYVRGGSRTLIQGFLRVIERAGGEVRLRSRVERILVERGRAVGVRLANGEEFRAPLVISNADAKRTLLELVGAEHLPPELAERVRGFRMALPMFVIYLAMRVPPQELGLPNSNLFLFPSYTMEEHYKACYAGRVPERPFVFVSIASLKDPESENIAPPGYTNLQVMTLAPAQLASWGVDRSPAEGGQYRHTAAYTAAKALMRERVLASVEELMPGLIRNVVWEECATPLTQERFTRSTGGTSYGFEHTPDQFLDRRLPFRTGVPGLYLCGQNTVFGHGIVPAILSGALAAQTALASG
jgi:phytoene dehydrogenase-like protein